MIKTPRTSLNHEKISANEKALETSINHKTTRVVSLMTPSSDQTFLREIPCMTKKNPKSEV